MFHKTILTALAALLLAQPSYCGLYPKNSAVLQLNEKSYDRLILRSNHTSIVEFYAPWCGHCKNLQPAYEKAAKALAGLAKVAAVDCDEESNKQFCGSLGIQGFPTLKIVKPGKKPGSPIIEDYQGPREAKPIIEAVKSKIPNYVTKLTDEQVEKFLSENNETAKAILFTEKGATSALLKAVAVDFLGSIQVAQIRSKEKEAVELFGITKYPTVVLLPGGPDAEGIVFDGEITKTALVTFLSQVATPNPDPAPAIFKMPKKDEKAAKGAKMSSASTSSDVNAEGTESTTSTTAEEPSAPTESPSPETPEADPIIIAPVAPPILTLATGDLLAELCLAERSGTCVLAFVSAEHAERGTQVLTSLAEIAYKHSQAKRRIFPFYAVPDENPDSATVKKSLGISGDVVVIALNRKRGWWRQYESADFSMGAIESWVDAIKMGDGAKQKLPQGIIMEKTPEQMADLPPVVTADADSTTESTTKADEAPEASTTTLTVEEVEKTKEAEVPEHNEL